MITLAVDCMGGDHGPTVTLEACRQFLDSHPDASLLLVGHPDHIPLKHPRARIVPSSFPDEAEHPRYKNGSVAYS